MKRFLVVLFFFLLLFLIVAKIFVFEIPVIAGNDMAPSIQQGDRLLAYRLNQTPRRGELVLFEHPQGSQLLVRRVVGLPHERIMVKGEVPIIDGVPVERKKVGQVALREDPDERASSLPMVLIEEKLIEVRYQVLKDPRRRSIDTKETKLQEAYYVLADNRNHGTDSRNFGPVPAAKIRAVITHRLSAGPGSIDPQDERSDWTSLR